MSRSSVDLPQPGRTDERDELALAGSVRSTDSSAVTAASPGAEDLADAGRLDDDRRGRRAALPALSSRSSQAALHGSVAAARQEPLGEVDDADEHEADERAHDDRRPQALGRRDV